MTGIRSITHSWPRRARLARAMAYGAFASIGVFAGVVVATILEVIARQGGALHG